LIYWIKSKLFEASQLSYEILLFWIPSHKDIPGNEIVDSLAKEAFRLGYKPYFTIPLIDFQLETKEFFIKKFRSYLSEATLVTGQMLRCLVPLSLSLVRKTS